MARQARVHADGGWYHLFNRGARRWDIFQTNSDRSAFVALLAQMPSEFGVEIHAFCLMDNHYHLVVRSPGGNLSQALGYLGQRYTQQFNGAHDADGPLFRGRFGSEPITSDRQLVTAVRYVALNPLDLVSVRHLDEYRWSSHRSYLGLRATPAWLTTSTVLGLAAGQEGYRALVESGDPQREKSRSTSLTEIERAVSDVTGASQLELAKAQRGRRNEPRLLLVLAVAEFGADELDSLVNRYGFPSAGAVRATAHRARRRREADEGFAALWRSIEKVTRGSVPGVT